MPELSRFFGIVIGMFPRDHPPPHFHAVYGEHGGVFQIQPLHLIRGQLPRRAQALVMEWASAHQLELLSDWNLLQAGQSARKIEPLE